MPKEVAAADNKTKAKRITKKTQPVRYETQF